MLLKWKSPALGGLRFPVSGQVVLDAVGYFRGAAQIDPNTDLFNGTTQGHDALVEAVEKGGVGPSGMTGLPFCEESVVGEWE